MNKLTRSIFCLLLYACLNHAAVFTVTNCQDTGEGSLHWAIAEAENHVGPDTIAFALTPQDPGWDNNKKAWKITIVTQLPEFLDGGTVIDGGSQTRFGGDTNPQGPEITIFGANAPFEVPAFIIRSAYNKFINLSIGAFPSYLFRLYGSESHHNVFQGLYLNIDVTGRYPYRMVKSEGIRMTDGPHHNLIGGRTPQERNIMCGFYGRAIYLERSHYNIVQGNYIGVKKNGLDPAGNGWTNEWAAFPTRHRADALEGFLVTDGSRGNQIGGLEPGAGNVIAANLRTGLRLQSTGTDSNIIQGNYCGVAADGRTPLGNGEAGLWIEGNLPDRGLGVGPAYNLVENNVVSANLSSGIQMRYGSQYNRFINNRIGTAAAGAVALPNSHNGIYFFGDLLRGYPKYNELGPGNIILADSVDTVKDPWAAVRLDDPNTSYNHVFGNYLCCNPEGTLSSRYNSAVYISKGAHHNLIGPDNVISGKNYRVWIRHDTTVCNTITRNRIIDVEDQAIFLDSGANANLPAPQLLNGNGTMVSGKTIPFGLVELFLGSGNRLAEYLGEIRADENGDFIWHGSTGDGWATATVRDSSGNTSMLAVSIVTPVELEAFRAERCEYGRVRLFWRTSTETNNLGFYVQKRLENGEFHSLAFLPGFGTTTSPHDYAYEDADQNATQESSVYRLLQMDQDGSRHYSQEWTVARALPSEIRLAPAYPNPFNSTVSITIDMPAALHAVVRAFDVQGRQVACLYDGMLAAGSHTLKWDARTDRAAPLASGVFWLELIAGDQRRVQKIMLLR